MSDALEAMIDDVLRPLLEADGGNIELVSASETTVVVRLEGEAAFGTGSHYVKVHVIEPALRKVLGSEVDIVFEKAVPKAMRRSDPG